MLLHSISASSPFTRKVGKLAFDRLHEFANADGIAFTGCKIMPTKHILFENGQLDDINSGAFTVLAGLAMLDSLLDRPPTILRLQDNVIKGALYPRVGSMFMLRTIIAHCHAASDEHLRPHTKRSDRELHSGDQPPSKRPRRDTSEQHPTSKTISLATLLARDPSLSGKYPPRFAQVPGPPSSKHSPLDTDVEREVQRSSALDDDQHEQQELEPTQLARDHTDPDCIDVKEKYVDLTLRLASLRKKKSPARAIYDRRLWTLASLSASPTIEEECQIWGPRK